MTQQKKIDVPKEKRAEWIFRLFAYTLTGLQCSLYVSIICIVMTGILFLITPSSGATIYSSENGITTYGYILGAFFILYLIVPTLLAWFFAYPFPLKRKKQTWGMRLMGLKLYHPDQENIKWSTVAKREFTKFIGLILIIGIFGLLWILFDKEERTFFDRISGTYVLKEEPSMKIVREFRDYQKQKSEKMKDT